MPDTPTHTPSERPSDEASPEGLRLAQEEGAVFGRAVAHMTQKTAQDGGEKAAGDYLIGYAVEEAEGMYHRVGGRLEWHEPQSENAHIEVVVRDAGDGRFLPGLTVHALLLDGAGKMVGLHRQPFLWHPELFHYGRNWLVPGDGEYTLRVFVEPPHFMRHDKTNGARFADPVEAEFTGVKIKTGRKLAE